MKEKFRIFIRNIQERYPLLGWITVTFLLLSCCTILVLCARGTIDISHYAIPQALRLTCGCKEVQEKYSDKLKTIINFSTNEKKLLNDSIEDIQSRIDKITSELTNEFQRTNKANESLIAERDSLEELKTILEKRLLEKDSLIQKISKVNKSGQLEIEDLHHDSMVHKRYLGKIDSLLSSIDESRVRLSILENVYISTISVRRVSDSHIIVSFTLVGVDTLVKYFTKDSPKVLLKVFDEENKSYIEMVEKNPQTGQSKHETASCLIKYSIESGNVYNDVCHFINTQDSPFTRGMFGLKPKKFTFLFYLPGYNRPLSYYPASLKRMKK